MALRAASNPEVVVEYRHVAVYRLTGVSGPNEQSPPHTLQSAVLRTPLHAQYPVNMKIVVSLETKRYTLDVRLSL